MSKHKSRTQALSHRSSNGLYASKNSPKVSKNSDMLSTMKTRARDIVPSAKEVKGFLPAISIPTVLSVGAVVLGAVGIYALWKNRDKVEAFMGEHDISLPSFLKGATSIASEQISAH